LAFILHDAVNWKFPNWRPNSKYAEYLKSPHWALIKFNVFAARGMKCELCGSLKDIDIHHKTYGRIGREKPEDLMVLCRLCHGKAHTVSQDELQSLSRWLAADQRAPRIVKLTSRE